MQGYFRMKIFTLRIIIIFILQSHKVLVITHSKFSNAPFQNQKGTQFWSIIAVIMNHQDFNGIYKWKFLVPIVYIINWSLIVVGPLFFPYAYQIMCMIIITYSVLKTWGLCLGTFVSLIKFKYSMKMLQSQQGTQPQLQQLYLHAIVLPSYKEDEIVLLDTLNTLAKSPRAKKQFMIFLAMEAHEQKSDVKAKHIIGQVKDKFYHADFTQHVVRNGEAKGKASNVSWCVEHFQQKLQPLMIDMNKIIITVIDADSWAPKEYFEMIQYQLKKRPEIKDVALFSAPQIYTRNHLDIPVFNRTFDTMHSLVQLANLVAVKFSFPLSNYSVSYNLMKRIGWWDTCADAIGEDFHTCQKCFWKVDETMYTVPIYIPFNQVSLSTGEGYCKDIAARFWQAERHTLGVSDVAYSCHMLFNTPFRFRNLWMTLLVIEVFTMAAVIPWALLGLGLQYKLMNDTTIHYFPGWLIELMLNGATVFTFISYVFYEWWRRDANSRVYSQENDACWRVIEYPVIFTFALFGFSIPSFIMASFAVLCTTTEYRVAEKHIQKAKSLQKKSSLNKPKSIQKKKTLLKPGSIKSDYTALPKNNRVANQISQSDVNRQSEGTTSVQLVEPKQIKISGASTKSSKKDISSSENNDENGSRRTDAKSENLGNQEEIVEHIDEDQIDNEDEQN